MPRMTKDETNAKLRAAVVAEAVEKGLSNVNVAAIVARAGVSAGTIYVHYRNKDDMLRQVYLQTKAEFHRDLLAAQEERGSHAMIRRMWFTLFDFVRDRPREFLFLEQGATARILTPQQQQIVDGYAADIAALLERGVVDGTLAPIGTDMLTLLLTAPAMQMARSAVMSGNAIAPEAAQGVFERVWLSIASNP